MIPKNSDDMPHEEEKRLLLQQFRSAISDILRPEHDDRFLMRFLISRDLDLKKTEKMLRESLKYRKKIEALDILTSNYEMPMIIKRFLETKFLGFDFGGSPVRTFLGGIYDYKGLSHSVSIVDWARCFSFWLESDFKSALEHSKETGTIQDKSVYLIDLQGFNIRQFCDKTVIQTGISLISMYQDNYPEMLKTAYLLNAPPYFTWVLNIFKPFIHERTMRKLKICRPDSNWKEDLLSHIDRKILPKYFGGDLDDPTSDPNILPTLTPYGIKVPLKYYLKSGMSLNESDPGMNSVVIKKASSFDHKLDISKPGTVIRWVFQTRDYNIKFGVLFKNANQLKSKKSPSDELIASELVDSHIMPERGELVCEKAGQYILHFDNSYSWWTTKEMLYKVDQELSSPIIPK